MGPGAMTATGPSTGRLSIPVDLMPFHGLGRGRPTLTDSTLTITTVFPGRDYGQAFPRAVDEGEGDQGDSLSGRRHGEHRGRRSRQVAGQRGAEGAGRDLQAGGGG